MGLSSEYVCMGLNCVGQMWNSLLQLPGLSFPPLHLSYSCPAFSKYNIFKAGSNISHCIAQLHSQAGLQGAIIIQTINNNNKNLGRIMEVPLLYQPGCDVAYCMLCYTIPKEGLCSVWVCSTTITNVFMIHLSELPRTKNESP